MKVTVAGKEKISGASKKTGKELNSIVLHATCKKQKVNGQAVHIIWLVGNTNSFDTIQIGKECNAEYDNRGFLVDFYKL